MNRSELIMEVAKRKGITPKESESIVKMVFGIISEKLAKREKVLITGFGHFDVHDRNPRKARNLFTGEPVYVPATKAPVFKAGPKLKKKIV